MGRTTSEDHDIAALGEFSPSATIDIGAASSDELGYLPKNANGARGSWQPSLAIIHARDDSNAGFLQRGGGTKKLNFAMRFLLPDEDVCGQVTFAARGRLEALGSGNGLTTLASKVGADSEGLEHDSTSWAWKSGTGIQVGRDATGREILTISTERTGSTILSFFDLQSLEIHPVHVADGNPLASGLYADGGYALDIGQYDQDSPYDAQAAQAAQHNHATVRDAMPWPVAVRCVDYQLLGKGPLLHTKAAIGCALRAVYPYHAEDGVGALAFSVLGQGSGDGGTITVSVLYKGEVIESTEVTPPTTTIDPEDPDDWCDGTVSLASAPTEPVEPLEVRVEMECATVGSGHSVELLSVCIQESPRS